MKGVDYIIALCYGNKIEKTTRERAERVLTALSSEHWIERSELKEVALDGEDDPYDNKFENVMEPLRGDKEEPLPVQAVVTRNRNGNTYYGLSWDAFNATLKQAKDNMRYYFSVDDMEAEIQRLERRKQMLEDRR